VSESGSGDLGGKVALVTGGGSGIGAGIACALGAAGASVAVLGRRRQTLEATAARIEASGGRAAVVTCDVTQADQLTDAVAETVGETGRLDIVVANAGAPTLPGPVLDLKPEQWGAALDLNLTGIWNTARAAVPHLITTGGGHLLVVGSSAGRARNAEWVGAYGVAKAGASHLVRVLAWELAQHQIAVNEVTPGLVVTPTLGAVDGELPDDVAKLLQDKIGDWIKHPEEIGRLARYLVSLPPGGTTGQSFNLERNR
jgi:NAD(P)-dependent dehydrogenase (short-subunit alcohol dehydrogenase family)